MRPISLLKRLLKIDRTLDYHAINQGRILTSALSSQKSSNIADYEFKIFSQWGEDGIIQFLVSNLAISNKTFIEFGIEDFSESNCRFLMMKDNWSGFVIDGSIDNINQLKSSYYYWQYDLTAECSFITKENISDILEKSKFNKNVGILSVDLDGIDYHVYEALEHWNPSILIFEYNGVFGSELPVSVPYAADFVRRNAHFSNQYWGASLPAFDQLAQKRGYALVGVNSVGSNAFYVKRGLLNEVVREVSLKDAFREASFRDSRDHRGELTFLTGAERRAIVHDLPLVNVVTGERLTVADLPAEDPGSKALT